MGQITWKWAIEALHNKMSTPLPDPIEQTDRVKQLLVDIIKGGQEYLEHMAPQVEAARWKRQESINTHSFTDPDDGIRYEYLVDPDGSIQPISALPTDIDDLMPIAVLCLEDLKTRQADAEDVAACDKGMNRTHKAWRKGAA